VDDRVIYLVDGTLMMRNDLQPQTWINHDLYVILWLGVLWLVTFLPTHLALRKSFVVRLPAVSLIPPFARTNHPSLRARL